MAEYLFLMHQDLHQEKGDWPTYIKRLEDGGFLRGGSAIGQGVCTRKTSDAPAPLSPLVGFLRVEARDLAQAQELLSGNPVFEGGGTVEIRELPRTD